MLFGSRLNKLATSIRRALSEYAVLGINPPFVADFIEKKYLTGGASSTFSSAINHARAGNATMTDGYGPELVTNGSFTDSIDGWSGAGWVWSSRGASYDSGSSVTVALSQDVAVEAGKTYIVTFTFIDVSGGTPSLMDGEQSLQSHSASGNYEYAYIADSSTFELGFRGGTATFYVDNVSVREMPVIKWAPHNLFSYSEQLDNSYWQKTLVTVSANSTVAPNGTTTADKLIPTVVNNSHYIGNVISYPVAGETYELCVFAKPAGYNFIKLFGANSGTSEAWFDISNGTKGTTGGTGFVSSSITDVGNGWYRCALKFINPDATARNTGYYVINADNVNSFAGDGTSGIHFWGAHLYKTDLGGMVDNPDRGDSYVPTTSSAVYLPRIGHHVYNGSAWVNEGLLAESEARVNLAPQSDFSNGTLGGLSRTANDAISPDGTQNAFKIQATSTAASIALTGILTNAESYAVSIYAKAGNHDIIRMMNGSSGASGQWFDLTNGTLLSSNGANNTATIQDVGNGWYRCTRYFDSVTAPATNEVFVGISDSDGATSGTIGDNVYLYGLQIENNATSSSFIPTSGSSVTRPAETFTIPSANLPWPTPQYIGDELVTNGTFDTDLSGWTAGSSWSWVSGKAYDGDTQAGTHAELAQLISVTSGKVYAISFDISGLSGGNPTVSWAGSTLVQITADGSYEEYVVATASNHTLQFSGQNAIYYVDNVSVREINPLSVSIGMDGRMTYADEDEVNAVTFWNWSANSDNRLFIRVRTESTKTGQLQAFHEEGNLAKTAETGSTYFSPDVLVPYDMASRFGSTFVNLAEGGVAVSATTTSKALPDLSAEGMEIAYDYMGTVSSFRVWDKDLGDAGLVEATEPSLEPSLSLTFEGVGTNSFVVNDWSQ